MDSNGDNRNEAVGIDRCAEYISLLQMSDCFSDEPLERERSQVEPISTNIALGVSVDSNLCDMTSNCEAPQPYTKHRWGHVTGNVVLSEHGTVAARTSGFSSAESRGLVFSEDPLRLGIPFHFKIVSSDMRFSYSLNIGFTHLNPSENNLRCTCIKNIPANIWYITGYEMRRNNNLLHRIIPSLEYLCVNDLITLELMPGAALRVLFNSEDITTRFENLPTANGYYVVVELKGATVAVQTSAPDDTSPHQDSLMPKLAIPEECPSPLPEVNGKRVILLNEHRRTSTSFSADQEGEEETIAPACETHYEEGGDIPLEEDGTIDSSFNPFEGFEQANADFPSVYTSSHDVLQTEEGFYDVYDAFYQMGQEQFLNRLREKFVKEAAWNYDLLSTRSFMPPGKRTQSMECENCRYFQIVKQYRDTLSLPEEPFLPIQPDCFCAYCKPLCRLLQGWVRFHVGPNPDDLIFPYFEDWEKMYCETRLDTVDLAIIRGQLMPLQPDCESDDGTCEKDEASTQIEMYLSPNSAPIISECVTISGQQYRVGAALQIQVRPESLYWKDKASRAVPNFSTDLFSLYRIATDGFQSCSETPSKFYVKEADSYIITGLLLKLEEVM